MRTPRVSILLPCRDAGAHLSEAVGSMLAQTFGDLELIAIDDGSRDDSRGLLESYARFDDRVRVLSTPPRGLVPALQLGLAKATGEFVARMDADDLAEPDRLAVQLERFAADADLAACGTQVRYFPREAVREGALRYEQWLNSLTSDACIRRDLFIECPIAHPTLLARRAVLESVGGYRDPGWPEDYDLVLRLWRAGHRLGNAPEVLHYWRERPDRLSRTDPRYGEDAFRRCKVHYLAPLLARFDGVVVWGAGPVGKAFARELQARTIPVRAFVDLDPRKLGQVVHGATVIRPEEVVRYRGAFVLAAVSGAAARAEIRAGLAGAGLVDGEHFLAVA